MIAPTTIDELQEHPGDLGTSDWHPVTQADVDRFADATGDHQWIHTDVARAREPRLTSREWEVLELMRRKMTTAQIARTLVVSPATVRSHVAAILRKLRVADREAAVRLLDNPEA